MGIFCANFKRTKLRRNMYARVHPHEHRMWVLCFWVRYNLDCLLAKSRNKQMWTVWPDLGNFCPMGDFLLWAVFWKIIKVAQILCLLFPKENVLYCHWQITFWATHYFINSSGHPDCQRKSKDWNWTDCKKIVVNNFAEFRVVGKFKWIII
jgi:hypothetical protein